MLEVLPATLSGAVSSVPSKSETHRALFLAALAEGPTTIANAIGASLALGPVRFSDGDPAAVAAISCPGFLEDLATLGGRVRR